MFIIIDYENNYKPGDQDGCWPWHKSILITTLAVIQTLHLKCQELYLESCYYENDYKLGDQDGCWPWYRSTSDHHTCSHSNFTFKSQGCTWNFVTMRMTTSLVIRMVAELGISQFWSPCICSHSNFTLKSQELYSEFCDFDNDYKPGDQDGCWPWYKSNSDHHTCSHSNFTFKSQGCTWDNYVTMRMTTSLVIRMVADLGISLLWPPCLQSFKLYIQKSGLYFIIMWLWEQL